MPVAHRTVISFGLVAIPVSMYTATQDNDIHFHQLHKEDQGRIRYKKTCAHCGKVLANEASMRGDEYGRGGDGVPTDGELAIIINGLL